MTQPADIVSPCIDVCDVDSTGQYCIGCGRSMDEIAAWLAMTADQRHIIMAELPARLERLER
jgi:uncharacterized protein